MKIEIRAAYTEDAEAVCELLRRSIALCCVDDHRNDPAILAAWLGNKTPANVTGWFRCSANLALVALLDGAIAGVAILTKAGKIPLFYVGPELRSRGIGRALLDEVENRAYRIGLEALQVPSTLTAQGFYERHGYLAQCLEKSCYGAEVVSMSKPLPTIPGKKRCGCAAA